MCCQLCGKSIGPVRRWVDREYCSAAHRREASRDIDRSIADVDEDNRPLPATESRAWHAVRAATALMSVMTLVLVLGVLSFSNVMATGRGGTPKRLKPFDWNLQIVAPVTHAD